MDYRGLRPQWRVDDRGATAVEYAIMVLLIAVAIFVAVAAFGGTVMGLFETAVGEIAEMLS